MGTMQKRQISKGCINFSHSININFKILKIESWQFRVAKCVGYIRKKNIACGVKVWENCNLEKWILFWRYLHTMYERFLCINLVDNSSVDDRCSPKVSFLIVLCLIYNLFSKMWRFTCLTVLLRGVVQSTFTVLIKTHIIFGKGEQSNIKWYLWSDLSLWTLECIRYILRCTYFVLPSECNTWPAD